MTGLSDAVVGVLEKNFADLRPVPLHAPDLVGDEEAFTRDCIVTGWVSSVGSYVDRFERELAEYTGATRAIAVVNGTAALHLALYLSGVAHDDEVLVPTLSFVATANACHYLGAVPHFVDSAEDTLGVDPAKLADYLERIAVRETGGCRNKETGRFIRALVPMHTFGHPVDIEPLVALCETYGIALVEDAAESLGSLHNGRHTGLFGAVGAMSFNGNKIVTTGGGGALLFADDALADRAKHVSTTAKIPHPYLFDHDTVGFNYRLPNVNAAIGCGQMAKLGRYVDQKRALHNLYVAMFADRAGARLFSEPTGARSNYWLQVLLLDRPDLETRDDILARTNKGGIMTRPAWNLLSGLSFHQSCPRMDLSCAEDLAARIVTLPSSPDLAERLATRT